ncbi:S1-like domain-containing RNA-binding protein [Caldibacillus thermolactis]|jgi:predicted RNA-binding protein (virulence factor B family)|uniref:S1-like domain-containing RNA-binding protein n=1 Tax=Pallidibacillus thermolactis TaxID=251051 RepID=A0ABT2WDP3_9BACI|nr:S1-like domain-containing RNA-binding protein [Pallidibacillus thermolactis]MCU9593799.1 S1-like domain-containing RNA-binding protein [Pallidibacillus thermolactis]MCU9601334.1 S1-like domain-containing RNA-binding protein [Pallidibacillus thermolactis subsp. kokeshiiformis]
MSQLKPGTVANLKVAREVDFGYFLTNGTEEVLLHKSEQKGKLQLEEDVRVFLYLEKLGRLAATMAIPVVQIGTYGWCKVVEVKESLGVFVNIGISKDILIYKDDLPKLREVWPVVGGRLYITLKTDKNGRLLGKLATETVMEKQFKKADRSVFNQNVRGYVYRTLYSGSFIITEEGYRGFIHHSQRKTEPHLGDEVSGRVIDVKEDGTINVSLLKRGYESIAEDAEKIFMYLQERGGRMPYTDKSQPEDIEKRFAMSKGAFKRALGRLMKEGKIDQEDGWTHIKKQS